MASFQNKTGSKRLKKRESKNYCFVSFRTDVLEKIQAKLQKNSINKKKNHYGFITSQNRWGKAEKEENKNFLYVPFRPDG